MSAVRIVTDLGDIDIELHDQQAPASAGYFLADVRGGLYNGTSFFRTVRSDDETVDPERRVAVIQGGLAPTDPEIAPSIPHETTELTGLRHLAGTVALARWAPGAVYHSFFICLRDEPALDFGGPRMLDGQGQAAFGRVTSGFEIVETIYARGDGEIVAVRELC